MKTTRNDAILHHLRKEVNIERHKDILDIIIPFYLSNDINNPKKHITHNSKIIKEIKKIIEYREKYSLFGICEKCQETRVHTMTYIGDTKTDGVILFQPSLSSDLSSNSIQKHLMNEMIKALKNKKSVILLFDFNNYPL